MASIRLVFEKNSLVSGNGHYIIGLDGSTPDDPRPGIHALFELNERINNLYRKFINNDNRIIGAERSILIETTEDLILVAVFLMKKFSPSPSLQFPSASIFPAEMEIFFHQDFWELSGSIPVNKTPETDSFAAFYDSSLSPALKEFLLEYKTSAFDSVISDLEHSKILNRLRDILYPLLVLYFLLYHMRMNK